MTWFISITGLAIAAALRACASPVLPRGSGSTSEPDPSLAYYVELNGKTYINKGLVGYGCIPSNATDTIGDTIGGIGSAIALQPFTWSSHDGTFSGTLYVQPDRGYNDQGTVNFQGRVHKYDFVLKPYYGTANLSYAEAAETLQLVYRETTLHYDSGHKNTTGLDALGIRPAEFGYPFDPYSDPQMPVASEQDQRMSLDAEGLVVNLDGTVWTSDEYGPYIYHFSADGALIQTITPPDAFLPHEANGALNFTAGSDPASGRVANQGFEGLSLDLSTNTLYALLQSALVQDGGLNADPSPYTRMLAFDISDPFVTPSVKGEYVVVLPTSKSGDNVYAASELHSVDGTTFLVLARDGKGYGDGTKDTSKYKQAVLVDISGATNVNTEKYNAVGAAVSPNGTLDADITPAMYVDFVDYLNATQLARFALHNGDPNDDTDIDGKWESLALASVGDPAYPDDYFLFTAADNDFQTEDGMMVGVPYNASVNENTQFMVFRLTLPGAALQLY